MSTVGFSRRSAKLVEAPPANVIGVAFLCQDSSHVGQADRVADGYIAIPHRNNPAQVDGELPIRAPQGEPGLPRSWEPFCDLGFERLEKVIDLWLAHTEEDGCPGYPR